MIRLTSFLWVWFQCVCPDTRLRPLLSYLGFSYLGRGVSFHGCSSKVQLLLLTLDEGCFIIVVPVVESGDLSEFYLSGSTWHRKRVQLESGTCSKKEQWEQIPQENLQIFWRDQVVVRHGRGIWDENHLTWETHLIPGLQTHGNQCVAWHMCA